MVGLSAHRSEALDGGAIGMAPLLRNGITPLLCAGASFCTMIFSRTANDVTSSRSPPSFTNPQKRGSAAGAEKIPLLAPCPCSRPLPNLSNTGGLYSAQSPDNQPPQLALITSN
jgi:hypothetical protein